MEGSITPRSTSSAHPIQASLEDQSLEFTPDGKFIRWSNTNPQHPRNWSVVRKAYDTTLIYWIDFFTTAVSTSGASAAQSAQYEFGTSHTFTTFIFVSLYLLGQALGGVVFPPFSESFGRRPLYIISMGLYSVSCLVAGLVPSLAGVVVGRFLSGLMSAIPTAVVCGSIEDMYNSKERILMVFFWAMVANTGLVTGPVMGTYITNSLGWRWVFYAAAIVVAITTGFLFGIRESRPSVLLSREVARLRKATGDHELRALNPDHTPDIHTFMRDGISRPLFLFFTEPIVFLVSIMAGFAFGVIYLFTEALPMVYMDMGFSKEAASLPFLALGIGIILSILTRILDHAILRKLKRQGKPITPESKLIGFSIGAPVLAAGFWWFAWTIPPLVDNAHWLASAASLVLVGYACNEFDSVLAGYLSDSYLCYSSSGFAALALVRALLSATFPLFAPQMYNGLGSNVATSILAGLATIFCIVPPLFIRNGESIRARSEFSRKSLEVYNENCVEKDQFLIDRCGPQKC